MVEIDGTMNKKYNMEWCVIGETVRGASHERSNQPNQDALLWFPEADNSLPLIVAISDGHGGPKHFRSSKGAALAVNAAISTLSQFQKISASIFTSSKIEQEDILTRSLVNMWRSDVYAHLQSEKFTDEEWTLVEEKEGNAVRKMIEANPVLAYGATILAVMITESAIIYMQLGDGDILRVSEKGETFKVFPKHKWHFANETTSLCSSDAWRDFQFHLEKFSPSIDLPALILLSTDGYPDSFSSEQDFFKVGSDLFNMIHPNNLEEIRSNLRGWLLEATQSGSGDDITLGMLCRMDALVETAPPQSIERSAQEEHIEGENLDYQSGHSYGPLQLHQAPLWNPL